MTKRKELNDTEGSDIKKSFRRIIKQLLIRFIKNSESIFIGIIINFVIDIMFFSIHYKWFEATATQVNSSNIIKQGGGFQSNILIGLATFTGIAAGISFVAVDVKTSEEIVVFLKKIFWVIVSFSGSLYIMSRSWNENYYFFIGMCILTLIGSYLIVQIVIMLIKNAVSYVKEPIENESILKKMNFIWIIMAAMIGWILKK